MTSQTINLNLIPGSIEPVINVSQYDKGQTWNFNIYSGSQPFTIPTGSSITIQGTKPDKTGFQYGCTFSGNVVTAIEQQQMTILSGKVPAEIVITKDDELIGSLNFNIMVEKAALADDTAISETDLPLIEEAVEALSHIDETLETMKGYKEDSEAYAIGKRNGSDVGSSDPAYHNNSKYYAGQASSSASSASGSATSAGTNALISEGYAVGKQNGSAVESGSPYYQNNAEYYKGQAANSATNAGNSATAASGSATTASNKALVAEGYADGKQNGTDVASGSPYYHNNSKYYSEQAAASAQSAAQSAASLTVDSALSTSSTNPVQNKVITTDLNDVKQALSNEVDARAELGAHNLLPIDLKVIKELNVASSTWSDNKCTISTANGSVEFTVNSNKSIGVKTTGTLDFTGYLFLTLGINYGSSRLSSYDEISNSTHKISGGSDAASATVQVCYDQLTEKTYIRVATGATGIDVTAYPMITLITDSDTTYRPYVPTNSQLLSYKDNGVLGAKNLLDMSKAIIVNNGLSTATINSDGTVFVNGTTTGQSYFPSVPVGTRVIGTLYDLKPNTTYKLSTGIAANAQVALQVFVKSTSSSSWEVLATNTGYAELEFTIPATFYEIWARITLLEGATFSNVTFKPMIRLASDTDPTYQPYAMTNKELTDVAQQVEGGYILIASGQTVEVTADGTKTHATLLNELYAAIGAVFSNNPSYYIRALSCRYGTVDYPISLPMELKNSISAEYIAKGFYWSSTNALRSLSISNNSVHDIYDLENATRNNISSDVPESGLKYIFKYDVYKKIS